MNPLLLHGSKYTTNINLQMNYWPAEVANLSDCADSLFQLIANLVEPGTHVAKVTKVQTAGYCIRIPTCGLRARLWMVRHGEPSLLREPGSVLTCGSISSSMAAKRICESFIPS